ncbi:hypothetical protein HMPREF9532_03427 [Escherichia coli MS 57-2]|nr:hypothetical protein HMPREF9532_03427 [Escherichia coli MS 57-2]EGB84053.1 hypothetical protein HMPREF9533_01091 [Escherichia coli MS 60-1]ESE11865.1 hypothetical protein HMPREF1615_00473 [Escherichia coli 908632]
MNRRFLRGPVIKITDSGSQRSHRIRMCFFKSSFLSAIADIAAFIP